MARAASLRTDEQGVAAIEFAVVAPVMIVMLFGIMELGYLAYAKSSLESGVLEAARASRVTDCPEDNPALIEEALLSRMSEVRSSDGEPPVLTVSSYGGNFSNVGSPEPFNDIDGNGVFDAGEPYTDINGNAQWDADMGSGNYGALGEVVQFSASYNVASFFPMLSFLRPGGEDDYAIEATTVIRNEPVWDAPCLNS